jgi:hypothetical protein
MATSNTLGPYGIQERSLDNAVSGNSFIGILVVVRDRAV